MSHVSCVVLSMLLDCCSSRFSQHSTFEGDRTHPPQLARRYLAEAPDSARVSETGTAKAADGAEKSKRKGRFQIVEEDPTDPGKRGVGRSTSVASMDSHRSAQVSFGLCMCYCNSAFRSAADHNSAFWFANPDCQVRFILRTLTATVHGGLCMLAAKVCCGTHHGF